MMNSKGSTLIFVLSLAIILNIAFISVYFTVTHTQKATGTKRVMTSVLATAEAGKERLYSAITEKTFTPTANSRVTVYSDVPFNKGNYSVSCSSNVTIDTVWITSIGRENNLQSTIKVVATISPDISVPNLPAKGAVTARSSIIVKGNINIDGRDFDTTGLLIGSGIFGVSTCGQLFIDGSSTIGGNNIAPVNRTDIGPVQTIVSEENSPVTTSLQSPEAFLGLAAGALDQYKVSSFVPPLKGIAYLTDNYVGPVHFDSSYGILIIHNAFKNAELQITDGFFKGLIITDLMAKITGDAKIIGSVVTLSEGEVSTFGTGQADILYSSYVMTNLGKYCSNIKKKVVEISWTEEKNQG